MRYLLDTHTMIWAITDPSRLSPAVTDAIQNAESYICVSAITFWEISLKHSKGRLHINVADPEILLEGCVNTGFHLLSLESETANSIHRLSSGKHKDPFDRMLIWTAIKNNFTFITKDKAMKQYQSLGLKILW